MKKSLDTRTALQMSSALRSIFGFDGFRPNQEQIVRSILKGRDAFAVMPTGGGKSLCFQLPAYMLPGTCVVISPLISLMKDQVDAAKAKGLRAEYLNSSQNRDEQERVRRLLESGQCDLLYVAPERFAMSGFLQSLKRVPLCLFAIDEAHCISDWGHDFRPDYLTLPGIVETFPDVPVAAFTATATRAVQKDIVTKLRLRNPYELRASFNRPNLLYHVVPKEDLDRQLLSVTGAWRKRAGIVYRSTRKSVEETAAFLSDAGIPALPYHAGLDTEVRKANQEAFIEGRVNVVVATIAFGMGIDKPDIRFVIHGDLPKNIEGYYQETGRAGRDGEPARCILFFDFADIPKIRYFVDKIKDANQHRVASEKLNLMIGYCTKRGCRRRYLLRYFGERYDKSNCASCDTCRGTAPKEHKRRASAAAGVRQRRSLSGVEHTIEKTWALIKQGLSYVEVARRRELKPTTISGHLETLIGEGRKIDVARHVPPARRKLLLQLFDRHGTKRLKPVVEAADGRISYDDARIVRAALIRTATADGR